MTARRWWEPSSVELAAMAIALLVAMLSWRTTRNLRAERDALALRAYNDSARADSSRQLADVLKDAKRVLGDSLAGATRLVVQQRQQNDQLDYALGVERTFRVALTARIDTLLALAVPSVAPVAIDSLDVRHAMFHVEHQTFTATLGVSLPAAGPAILDSLLVNPAPARLALRIGCEPANGDGVRPARVTVTSPTWMAVSVGAAEQSPEVCQVAAVHRSNWLKGFLQAFTPELYLGVGASIDPLPMLRGEPAKLSPAFHVGVSLVRVPLRLPWPK